MNLSEIFLNDGSISPTLMLWTFFLAVVIGTVVYYLTNAQMCKLVTKLLEIGADSPETAVNLRDAEIQPGFLLNTRLKSPASYKDLLVAITYDGKYYANFRYTDTPPALRQLTAITRIRKSKIKTGDAVNTDNVSAEPAPSTEIAQIPENQFENEAVTTQNTPQKVNFNPITAKFYIPKEVHDKVKNIYKSPKTKLLHLILLILGFAAVTFLATLALDTFIDMFSNLGT